MNRHQSNYQRALNNLAAITALCNELHNLEEAISDLLRLLKSMPEGEFRDKLLDQISDFDSIADTVRQTLDGISFEQDIGKTRRS